MKALITLIWTLVLATAVSAQDNYLIRPGDTLRIEVLEDPTLNRNVIILPDGRFSFPFAGTILAGGRTLNQVESSVSQAIASNFSVEPNVFASVLSLRPLEPQQPGPAIVGPEVVPTISVFFLGEVASPGERNLAPGVNFLQALAQSGGLTSFAADKRIQLRRVDRMTGRPTMRTINLKALMNGAQLQNNIVLQDGDVILVPERRLFE